MNPKAIWPAERDFLGICCTDPLVLDEYGASLVPADFSRPPHGNLWARLLALRADPEHQRASGEAWVATVLTEAYGWGQDVDGAAYVAALVSAAPHRDAAAYYVRQIGSAASAYAVRLALALASERIGKGEETALVVGGLEQALNAIALRGGVASSSWVPIGETAREVYDETNAAQRDPSARIRRVVPSPWPTLNRLTRGGFRRGEMMILAGRPGTGKTAAAMQIAEWAAEHGGVGVFSMEMTRHGLTTRELAREGRVDLTSLTEGRLTNEDWRCLTKGVEILDGRPIWIDDTPALHVTALRARAKRLVQIAKAQGVELRTIVVDYVQLATATVAKGETEQIVLSRISQAMVAIAKELDVAVVALAQMNRAVEGRTGERPKNSDLRGSGQLEQDAAVIVFTYRDADSEDDNARELILTKARHGETGSIPMRWEGRYQTLYEVDTVKREPPPRLREVREDDGETPW